MPLAPSLLSGRPGGGGALEADYLSPLSLGGAPFSLMIYCEDTDAADFTAIGAGCLSAKEPAEMFWGDRFAQVKDPYGFLWSFATHVRDVSQAEMREVLAAMSAKGG